MDETSFTILCPPQLLVGSTRAAVSMRLFLMSCLLGARDSKE